MEAYALGGIRTHRWIRLSDPAAEMKQKSCQFQLWCLLSGWVKHDSCKTITSHISSVCAEARVERLSWDWLEKIPRSVVMYCFCLLLFVSHCGLEKCSFTTCALTFTEYILLSKAFYKHCSIYVLSICKAEPHQFHTIFTIVNCSNVHEHHRGFTL